MNNLIDLVLLCSTLFLAAMCFLMFFGKVKQKKQIIESIRKTKEQLSGQYTQDETKLKSILGAFLNDDLQLKITDILNVEKTNYQNLMILFLDYHPAAIEMLPTMLTNVIAAYMDCIQFIVVQSKTLTIVNEAAAVASESAAAAAAEAAAAEKEKEDDAADAAFQYEALIEQLRYEKQDFADKYKSAQNLLNLIYLKYKGSIEVEDVEATTGKNLEEIAQIFKVEFSVTKAKTIV
jgi:hypothetical protein